mmetsp:Transcript_18085/g.21976  ORF Transcript_18085/g.21976 Transcript_18085/m.21976 type:complete len:83 (+) Transcript_18085:395-643(+)
MFYLNSTIYTVEACRIGETVVNEKDKEKKTDRVWRRRNDVRRSLDVRINGLLVRVQLVAGIVCVDVSSVSLISHMMSAYYMH